MKLERALDVLVAFKGRSKKPAASYRLEVNNVSRVWNLHCLLCPSGGPGRCAHYLVFIFINQDFHTVPTLGAITEKMLLVFIHLKKFSQCSFQHLQKWLFLDVICHFLPGGSADALCRFLLSTNSHVYSAVQFDISCI